jgi:hypothetical protein
MSELGAGKGMVNSARFGAEAMPLLAYLRALQEYIRLDNKKS